MAKCIFCGEKAGLFKKECNTCKQKRIIKEKEKELQRKQNLLNTLEEERKEVLTEIETFLKDGKIISDSKKDYNINFMKSEMPFFSIEGIGYFLEKTKTHYQGGSTGYSFKVAKGFWIRQNAFKGTPVKHDILTLVDFSGKCILTNKHIYWKGDKKSFRIKLEKLIHLNAYSNGIDFMRDTASAKPEFIGYNDQFTIKNKNDEIKMAFAFDLFKDAFDLLMK